MATNERWLEFVELLTLDTQEGDETGIAARALYKALGEYSRLRFGDSNPDHFIDIVTSRQVNAAVKQSLANKAGDRAAIRDAVANAATPIA